VAGPHAGAETVERVVGDDDGVVLTVELRHRHHRTEDLLLEDPPPVVAGEDGGLHVVAAGQVAAEVDPLAAQHDPRALGLADVDVDVDVDLLQLIGAGLSADHRLAVQRVALPNRLGADRRGLKELVRRLAARPGAGRTGAHLALVEGERAEPSSDLSAKSSFSASTSEKKMFGLLPPSSSVTGMMFCEAYCMIRHPGVVSPGARHLLDPGAARQRLAVDLVGGWSSSRGRA